jgi:hypothetical protein
MPDPQSARTPADAPPIPPLPSDSPGLTVVQAGELLDWLENHGYTGLEVCHHEGGGFTVRQGRPA